MGILKRLLRSYVGVRALTASARADAYETAALMAKSFRMSSDASASDASGAIAGILMEASRRERAQACSRSACHRAIVASMKGGRACG